MGKSPAPFHRFRPLHPFALSGLIAISLLVPVELHAQVNVLTNRYDPQRTGANLKETTLRTTNVTVSTFGKLYSFPVDGAVYAQPLYMEGVTIGGVVHNVLFVATMNDKVYAFDANGGSLAPLWSRDFTNPPAVTPVPITDIVQPDRNIIGNVGIQGTPVIDQATGTLYLVARTKESGQYFHRLHALSVTTGEERPGSPVKISGSVAGNAPDATTGPSGNIITFDPRVNLQRAGLALVNGVVLIAWAAHEDITPSHGWIMGFDSSTLARVATFAVVADEYLGGVWQGGRAPAVDVDGNVYFATGNGFWDGKRNWGNSLLKFSVSRTAGLTILDYFTPGNETQLTANDADLGGSGFTLLPGTNLLLGGGKEGVLYLIDKNNLGHKVANDTQIVQRIPVSGGHVMGGVVYWNSPAAGPLVYNWSEDDVLKAYKLSGGVLSLPPYAQGEVLSPGHPGGSLTVSANGSTAGTGIIWAMMPTLQDDIVGLVAGILRAYDADTLAEIWNSDQNSGRDRLGTLMKFVPPVVVNGRVYVPNQDNEVVVYGLLPSDFSLSVAPGGVVIPPGGTGQFTVTVSAEGGFTGQVALAATGQPAGTTVSFSPSSVTGSGAATMTVAVPSNAPGGSFWISATGSSGGRVHSSNPVLVTVSASGSRAAAIGVNFVGGSTTTMAVTEQAGVVATPNWNNAAGASRSAPLSLVDETGATTAASITWASAGTWRTPITDQAGNSRMMKGYLDTTNSSTTTITVAGLASGSYDVYVYADGDNHSYSRTASYTIKGAGISTTTIKLTDPASTNFGGTFSQANGSSGNYVKFTITGTGFTISATPVSGTNATLRAPVNGIQIVPVGGPPVRPTAVSVDFTGSNTTAMGATELAGVVARPNWNNAAGAARTTPLSLVDETGAATSAAITWSSSGTWSTPITDSAGNARMMKGYLDTTSASTTTVTVTGLVSAKYDVYVYADGDNHTYARTGAYTISGPGIVSTTINLTDPASTNFGSTFTQANNSSGNYVKFTITATGFTLTATPLSGTNTTLRAPINGIQIVPVPPPPGAIGVNFVGTNTMAMAAAETAGVVAKPNWNNAIGAARSTPLTLIDETGAVTGAGLTWTANGTWSTPITDQEGNARMMKGYLDTSSTSTTTIAVTGLTSGTYDVYVYADGDNKSYSRTAAYTISGTGSPATTTNLTDAAGVNFTSGFARAENSAGNYVKFTITGTGFTLTAMPASGTNTTLRAPVNGIQIVPATTP